jgi:hypothetical protein
MPDNIVYIYKKGVAVPVLETNLKWLERTREGVPCFATAYK